MINAGGRKAAPRLDQYAQTVEQILLGVGVDPQQARMNIQDGFGWSFRRGSARAKRNAGRKYATRLGRVALFCRA